METDGLKVALTTYGIAAVISMLTAAIISVSTKIIEHNAERKLRKRPEK